MHTFQEAKDVNVSYMCRESVFSNGCLHVYPTDYAPKKPMTYLLVNNY